MNKKPTRKPVIAVVSGDVNEKKQYYIYQNYIQALRQSGSVPLVIPPGEIELETIYQLVDGVLLAGGSDIDPALYGGDSNTKNVYGISKERDMTEIKLTKLALNGDKPILAICRGLQLVNVLLGGSLYEDIENKNFGAEKVLHRKSQIAPSEHLVKVKGGKIITQIAKKNSNISGFSQHHQAIKKIGKGLSPVAYAKDGIIEACELEGHAWFFGIQWHPEMSFEKDYNQKNIFDIFVKAALKNIKNNK